MSGAPGNNPAIPTIAISWLGEFMEIGDELSECQYRRRWWALNEAIQGLADRHLHVFSLDPDASLIIRPMPVTPDRRGIKTGDSQKKVQRPDVVGRRTEAGHLGEMIG